MYLKVLVLFVRPLFLNVILSGKTVSARGCFSAVPCHANHAMSRFNSWMAGAWVSFLPRKHSSSQGSIPLRISLPANFINYVYAASASQISPLCQVKLNFLVSHQPLSRFWCGQAARVHINIMYSWRAVITHYACLELFMRAFPGQKTKTNELTAKTIRVTCMLKNLV